MPDSVALHTFGRGWCFLADVQGRTLGRYVGCPLMQLVDIPCKFRSLEEEKHFSGVSTSVDGQG